ncbi:MAG: ATP-binding protein [Lachnospiraceae bacterium]|nr:ATP-binding protein [Lachnospiraceae bacterium]
MQKLIERTEYLEWLKRWREQQIIKVVSGVRRCGKSTLFEIYKNWLISDGVEKNQIISINLEDIEFENLTNYRALYDHIKAMLIPDKMNYIFLDEIQHVDSFEKAVDSLFLKDNCDVYITGSNAYFMSGELATVLSGRYVELKMLPLSFKEFCIGFDGLTMTTAQKFNRYVEYGSFPYIVKFRSTRKEARDYLRDIYHSVLLKDIVARLKISDVTTLENITKFMLHNIGNLVSATKIANTLKSEGKSADQKTVDKYLRGLTDSLMIYEAQRYNLKGKMFLKTNSKYYVVDTGLRNCLVKGSENDIGHILENVVFLELKRRGYDVYVGQLEDGEIDFVAVNGEDISYYQVSATTLEENTLKRELAPFRKVGDNYPKYLLTLDEIFGSADYDGIKKKNVLDWLLEPSVSEMR